MKKAPAKPSAVVRLRSEQLKKLDAQLRRRELRLRAEGKRPLKQLLDASNPNIRVIDLYKF